MNKSFTFIMLASVSILSADQYSGYNYDCPSCNTGRGSYQTRSDTNYSGDSQYGNGYNQSNDQYGDRSYQRSNQSERYDQRNQSNDNMMQRNVQPNDNYIRKDGQDDRQDGRSNNEKNSGYMNNNSNQKMIDDQEIAKQIRDTLTTGWFTKGYEKVTYEVTNGNVILSGSVDSMEKKNKAEENVKKIDGVKQVNNQITVGEVNVNSNSNKTNSYGNKTDSYSNKNAYTDDQLLKSEKNYNRDTAVTSQDRQLNARIRDKLNGWVTKGYEAIVIATNNGVVVITGTVDKTDDVQKINDNLKNVDGVKRVDNRVTVLKK